jgi:mRNA-degrading endonuclease RelE of RelBE toxin-antitoxin system
MNRMLKFLRLLSGKQRVAVDFTLEKIKNLDLEGFDIEKMSGFKTLYRVRIGKIRIIFIKHKDCGELLNLHYRGKVYKKRR